jgi:acyl-CoA dehydrogenase
LDDYPRADFFTLAVRTGKAGPGGISLLLVDAKTPGFRVRTDRRVGGMTWNWVDEKMGEIPS